MLYLINLNFFHLVLWLLCLILNWQLRLNFCFLRIKLCLTQRSLYLFNFFVDTIIKQLILTHSALKLTSGLTQLRLHFLNLNQLKRVVVFLCLPPSHLWEVLNIIQKDIRNWGGAIAYPICVKIILDFKTILPISVLCTLRRVNELILEL